VLNLAPLVCPVAIRLLTVCGPRMEARMTFHGDGRGAGKPSRGKSPRPLIAAVLGETLPFIVGEAGGDPKDEGQSRGGISKAFGG